MSIIKISLGSNSNSVNNSDTTLKLEGVVYHFDTPASCKKVAQQLQQGLDVSQVLEEVEIKLNPKTWACLYNSPQWSWVRKYIEHVRCNGGTKPAFTLPTKDKGVIAEWEHLVNTYWDLLSIFPLNTSAAAIWHYAKLVLEEELGEEDYPQLIIFHEHRGVWLEDFEEETMEDKPCFLSYKYHTFRAVMDSSPEIQESFLDNWNALFEEFYEMAEEAEDECEQEFSISLGILKQWLLILATIEEIEDFSSIQEAWFTLVYWGLKNPVLDTNGVEARFYPYSTNVLKLASSKKQQEIQQEKGIMFGVELEFCHSEYPLAVLYALMAMGVFKMDSSVDGEYVTLPYTYEEMVTKLTSLSETFDKLLSANGWEGCGMHVHVSRQGLTITQMLNLQYLLNPSTEEGKAYWETVADRKLQGNQYCDFIKIEERTRWYVSSRYVLLNFKNQHTVEFRMFKAPKTTEKVLWNLAVVRGLLEFSKTSSSLEQWMVSPLNPQYEGKFMDPEELPYKFKYGPVFKMEKKILYVTRDIHDYGWAVAVNLPN